MFKPDIIKSDYEKREALPEGMYECVVQGYKTKKSKFYHPEPYIADKDMERGGKVYAKGEEVPADPAYMEYSFNWTFEVVDGPFAGRWLFDNTGTALTKNERNKLHKLLGKVLGVEELDERIDNDDAPDFDTEVLGRPVIVMVDKLKNKDTGEYYNKVTGYMKSGKEFIDLTGSDGEEIEWS